MTTDGTATRPDPGAQQRYDDLFAEVFALYTEGRYADALAALARRPAGLEPWSSDLTHVAACLESLTGHPDRALAAMEAGLADGQWWDERILVDDADLAPVRELAGFEPLCREANARALAYNAAAPAEPPVVLRPATPARGVVVALHGSGQRAEPTARTWSAALDHGHLVVAVASSQRSTPTHTSWPDQRVAVRDVEHALTFLTAEERSLPLLAGGFSAGGRAALLWALTGEPVAVPQVLVVAPSVAPEQLPDALPGRLDGVVLLGADDDLSGPVLAMAERLHGIGLRVESVEGLGHRYPDDFAARLTAELAGPAG